MKRVSAKTFFTVLWSGLCQALGWFFGLFGYKRDGKFAKCVWGLFATSAAVILTVIACVIAYDGYDCITSDYRYSHHMYRNCGQYISKDITYHEGINGNKGYLVNKKTGKKVLKGIKWIAKPLGADTLVCFCNGSKRGYFNMKDGKVIIKPQYDHAWIFSDGIAAVDEGGIIKYIDGNGHVAIDTGMDYDDTCDNYVYHGGYLIVYDSNTYKYGLIDKSGKSVLAKEYDNIEVSNNYKLWQVYKDGQTAVYDSDMEMVLPFMDGYVYISNRYIDVTLPDHTMRKYDYDGNLLNDFYIYNTRHLRYDTGEICYEKEYDTDEYGDEYEYVSENNITADAHLRAYSAGDRYQGLMTPEGHIVTMPLYEDIEAIGPDTYLCMVSDGDKVIVNGKGEIVR